MSERDASTVGGWHYEGEYEFYDFEADADDLAELLDPVRRGDMYFAVDDQQGELVGFFQFKQAGKSVEIGLGLRPDLVGRGLGADFVDAAVRYAQDHLGADETTLEVAAFNARAITVYERAGFVEVERFQHATNGGVHPFVRMRR